MKEANQDLERRELVFRVLDELKGSGERINADKVARLAKMGKQTVLPYYKEWRFLDDVDRQQQEDLPDELVRLLKRGIAKWKHSLAKETQAIEETANAEIDELKQTVQLLGNTQTEYENQITSQTRAIELAEEATKSLQDDRIEKDKVLATLKAELIAEQNKSTHLQDQLSQQKQEFTENTKALEVRLDQRHQEQLDHWIKVVDDERRQKSELEKNQNLLKEAQLTKDKECNELSHRLDSKARAFLEACEERNSLRKDQKKLQHVEQLVSQSTLLLDCPEEQLTATIRATLNRQHQAELAEEKLILAERQMGELQTKLQQQEVQLSQFNELSGELKKARGYIEAFEKHKPLKDSNNKENREENP